MSDKVRQAKDLLNTISTMLDSRLGTLKHNKKKKAVIIAVNGNGTADIKINDETFENVKIRSGLNPLIDEIVWVEIPNNNMNEMFIDTSQNIISGGGGETDHSHSNLSILETISLGLINTWNTVTDKVDKVTGKGLSTNDFDNSYKSKIDEIADGAEINVNSDWNAVSGDAQILNKPTIPTQTSDLTNDSNFVVDASYIHTDNNFTTIEKSKLSGIESSANNYTHPSTHNADIIVDGTTNKVYTAIEKTKLNGIATDANNYVLPVASATIGGIKSGTDITIDVSGNVSVNDDSHNHIISNVDGLQTALDGKVDDSQVLTNVPAGALFTDTVYTHPINHPASIITQDASNRFVTDTEKTTWSGKQDALGFTPVNTTDGRLSDARTPIAHNHVIANITDLPTIPTDTNQLTKTDVYTKTEVNGLISASGGGDMLEAEYDTNGDGKVNNADNADTVGGFTVAKNVPADAVFTDTVYTHPITHSPSIIEQDVSNRFVTDAQITAFTAKPDVQTAGSATDGTVHYNGTTKAAGNFDGGATAPTNATRLNYDGYFYSTRLYQGTVQVATLSGTETLSGKTLTAPRLTTNGFIADANGNEIIKVSAVVASAVNEVCIGNNIAGQPPHIIATGGDTDINLHLEGKGTGKVYANGVAIDDGRVVTGTVAPINLTNLWIDTN